MSKKGKWVTISLDDIKRGQVKRGPHQLTKKILSWPYCAHCGLVALKNKETRKALKQQCEWEID